MVGIVPYISLQMNTASNSFTIVPQYPEIITERIIVGAPRSEGASRCKEVSGNPLC